MRHASGTFLFEVKRVMTPCLQSTADSFLLYVSGSDEYYGPVALRQEYLNPGGVHPAPAGALEPLRNTPPGSREVKGVLGNARCMGNVTPGKKSLYAGATSPPGPWNSLKSQRGKIPALPCRWKIRSLKGSNGTSEEGSGFLLFGAMHIPASILAAK